MRLAPKALDDADVRRAARVLLAGRTAGVVGEDAELFQDRDGNGRALRILLRLLDRSWCAVDGALVQSLSQDALEAFSVGQADHRALHRLLGECLGKPVDWTGLSDEEVLHLLQHLYGVMTEDQERWRAMPLHRDVDGKRGPFDDRALRTTGGSDDLRLPPELNLTVRLLDPEPSVARLYDAVPIMDSNGVLRAILENSHPWRFAEQIVDSVRSADGQIALPKDSELRERLRHTCWLPVGDDDGVAPEAVLIAPEEVLKEVSSLALALVLSVASGFPRKSIPKHGRSLNGLFEKSSGV